MRFQLTECSTVGRRVGCMGLMLRIYGVFLLLVCEMMRALLSMVAVLALGEVAA